MPILQEIFLKYGEEYCNTHQLSYAQGKAFKHIKECRTEASGIHIRVCEECGFEKIAFNSCKNRHCNLCQTFKKEEWINDRKAEVINTKYFHLVFTVPDDLNTIIYQNQDELYTAMFKASSETLHELSQNEKWIGAVPGFMSVLHTWGQTLNFHPHIHCIVTGGGLTEINTWKKGGKDFFIPVKVLSKKFRGKFIYYLKESYKNKKLNFYGSIKAYENKNNFQTLVNELYSKSWCTYARKPFSGPEAVIEYLGRYTHRVAISNNRIMKIEDGNITFKWKDYKDENKVKDMTLSAEEFIRRFMLHILPSGFMKIRYYGILANRNKKTKLVLCQKLTRLCNGLEAYRKMTKEEILIKITNGKAFICACCGRTVKWVGMYQYLDNTG